MTAFDLFHLHAGVHTRGTPRNCGMMHQLPIYPDGNMMELTRAGNGEFGFEFTS
jgi:hypothetical protein